MYCMCRNHFGGLFDGDKEELDEAVAFLHLQGTCTPQNVQLSLNHLLYTGLCMEANLCVHKTRVYMYVSVRAAL